MNSRAEQTLLDDQSFLLELARTKMPYGKYQGRYLVDLPEPYVVWYHRQGFPKGKLGKMLGILFEIKVNGLEYLLRELQKAQGINDDR